MNHRDARKKGNGGIMRQYTKWGAVAILPFTLAVFAANSCKKPEDDNVEMLVGAALLMQGQKTSMTQSSAAASGASAAMSGVSSGGTTWALLQHKSKDKMLAELRKQYRKQTGNVLPDAIATAFTCADGTCNKGANETLTGSANCILGGTITANNVAVNMSASSTTGSNFNVSMTTNGPFTFNNCMTSGYDYSTLPALSFAVYTLSGSLTINGSWGASYSISGSTITGSSNVNTKYTSSNLTVNGTGVTMDLTDTSNYSSTSTSTASSASISLNGTIRIVGTVNGTAVNINVPISQTFTCTLTGATFTCT